MISSTRNQVLLATAGVILFSENGGKIEVRALLDSAPQTTFVTRDTIKMLKARTLKVDLKVPGISQSGTHVSEMVDLILESKRSNTHKKRFSVTCGILNKITCELPQVSIDTSKFSIPYNIDLADIGYNIPAKIYMLIGADLCFDLIEPGLIKLGSNLPILQTSKL
ncbi:hypothetical protein JTB14_015524 [Gonioctena quinquepunctata]|nr:hypothetical protein JTB14_015524 [Gonioctena quinquepunctata]